MPYKPDIYSLKEAPGRYFIKDYQGASREILNPGDFSSLGMNPGSFSSVSQFDTGGSSGANIDFSQLKGFIDQNTSTVAANENAQKLVQDSVNSLAQANYGPQGQPGGSGTTTPANPGPLNTDPGSSTQPTNPANPANPANPSQPALQFPSFDQALSDVYNSRPDLQALYNPDGTAKNPSNKKVKNIPTLQAWAKQYGVHEEPLLRTAQANPAGGSAPGTSPASTSFDAGTKSNQPDPNTGQSTPTSNPFTDFTNAYSHVLESLGVPAIKQQLTDTINQRSDLQNELNSKISDVNENPWLSEAQRSKKITQLQDKYQSKLDILTQTQALYDGIYKDSISQAQFLTGQAMSQISHQQDLAEQDKLKAIDIAEKRVEAQDKLKLAELKPFNAGKYGTWQINPDTGTWMQIAQAPASGGGGGGVTYTPGVNSTVDSWVNDILNGNATIANVPANLKNSVAVGVDQSGGTAPLAGSRFTMESNRIVGNFVNLPQYQLTANGLPYLQRIDAAMKTPGSISDQDLLDSLTKLNTSGNAISDAQVRLITDGQSYSDWASVLGNKFKNGGVLSDNQRKQVQTIANAIYANYQKGYQPVYNQVTAQLKAAGIPKQFWTIPDLNNLSAQAQGGSSASGDGQNQNTNDPMGLGL